MRRAAPVLTLLAVLACVQPALAQVTRPAGQTARPVPKPPQNIKPQPAQKPQPAARPVPVPKPAPQRAAAMLVKNPPLPLPRPKGIDGPPPATVEQKPLPPIADEKPAAPPAEQKLPGADDAALAACLAAFAEKGGVVIATPPADPPVDPADPCAIPGPVTFSQIHVKDGPTVRLESAITVRCTLALEIANWIRDDLSPLAKRHGTDIAQLTGVGGHACRPRNGQKGAQISEHASGNAFDMLGLKLANGRQVELWRDDVDTKEIREDVRKSACDRFFTVLGPGADSAHANHVHLDLRQRRNNFRMCQWDVK